MRLKVKRVVRRGSKKGLLRRHLEGKNTPCQEYDPLRARPMENHSKVFGGSVMFCHFFVANGNADPWIEHYCEYRVG